MYKILNYFLGIKRFKDQRYIEAYNCFLASYDYKDSYSYCVKCLNMINEEVYQIGLKYMEEKKYLEAISVFKSIINYRSSNFHIEECEELLNTLLLP